MAISFTRRGPRAGKEFNRIVNLPQRDPVFDGEAYVTLLTELLRQPKGLQCLRPLQALALAEGHLFGGVLILLAVGEGKTLISYLLPTVMESENALLIVPAKLRQKTIDEFAELEQHWIAPENLTITSYTHISTHPEFLQELDPDLIIADESHKLKNIKAGCTKRVIKHLKLDTCRFVAMSGTLAKRSFFDWWHLQIMALPEELRPLPTGWKEAELWAQALDEKTENRADLGTLSHFGKDIFQAREGYGNFLRHVPGVIASQKTHVASSIRIELIELKNSYVNRCISNLSKLWELPNGQELTEASEMWRHSRELSNGFYYIWAEQPPEEWRQARLEYNRFIRATLQYSRKFETPKQVADHWSNVSEVVRWREVEPTFKPKTKPVLLLDMCPEWLNFVEEEPTLIWFEHRYVGERLADSGIPVYGSKGLNIRNGKSITTETRTCGVSVHACNEGFNLQHYSHNLVLNHPPAGSVWEQTIGRTHRPGQNADEVVFKIIRTSDVQKRDFEQALADADYLTRTTGQKQKLSIADIIKG